MHHIFSNIILLLLVLLLWTVMGLGFTLILVPRRYKAEGLFLAPLLGMSLLSVVGLLEISILLTPLTPFRNSACISLLSCALCYYRRTDLSRACARVYFLYQWFFLVPFLYLVLFAAMFDKEGFQLLLGSQDQLQYCQSSRYILEEMHTSSPAAIPVPRADHYLYDSNTRLMPHFKAYRRGAELLLASVAAHAGLSPEEAFSVTVCTIIVTLGLALCFLGRVCLYFVPAACLILQLTFMSSFVVALLHVQGSLACLSFLPLSLIALALVSHTIYVADRRYILLSGVLVGSVFTFYAEAAFLAIAFPTLVVLGWGMVVPRSRRMIHILCFLCIYCVAFVYSPYGFYSFVQNTNGNIEVTLASLHSAANQCVDSSDHPAVTLADFINSPLYTQLSNVIGFSSYYDPSSFNYWISNMFCRKPWAGLATFLISSFFASLGLLLWKGPSIKIYALVLATWATMCLIMAPIQDMLRFFRSAQYAIPFIIVGLVALSFSSPLRYNRFYVIAVWLGRICLISFLFFNMYSNYRTFRYIVTHDSRSDQLIHRFNERAAVWQTMKEELKISQATPILISGFKDTVRPHMIICGIRFFPHFLGKSITSFWRIEPNYNPSSFEIQHSRLNTQLSKEQFLAALVRENEHYLRQLPVLLEKSRQAIVPVGHPFPIEWNNWRDIFTTKVTRFQNICDIVYKDELSVSLVPDSMEPLEKDDRGIYRIVHTSGPILIHDRQGDRFQLSLAHDGSIDDIELHVNDKSCATASRADSGRIILYAEVVYEDSFHLSLVAHRPVKMRSLLWRKVEEY